MLDRSFGTGGARAAHHPATSRPTKAPHASPDAKRPELETVTAAELSATLKAIFGDDSPGDYGDAWDADTPELDQRWTVVAIGGPNHA